MPDCPLELQLVSSCYNFSVSLQPYCSTLQRQAAPEEKQQQLPVRLSKSHIHLQNLDFFNSTLTHGAYSFRVSLNLTNTTYLAASRVDRYKSKLRTISAASLWGGTKEDFLLSQGVELTEMLCSRKLLPANDTNHQLRGNLVQMKKSPCIPISCYLFAADPVLLICFPLPQPAKSWKDPSPFSASNISHVLVALQLQNINSLLIKDYLDPTKLLKYASVLPI